MDKLPKRALDELARERKRRELAASLRCPCVVRLERDENGCLHPVYCYRAECARLLFSVPQGDTLPGVPCGCVGEVKMGKELGD